MKLKANYHTHTLFCDGTASPEDMVKQALRLGFDHLGFSGHVDISPKMDIPAYQAGPDAAPASCRPRRHARKEKAW